MTLPPPTASVGPAPAFDPDVARVLAAEPALSAPLRRESLPRDGVATMFPDAPTVIAERAIDVSEYRFTSPESGEHIELSVFRPRGHEGERLAVLYNIHGGGMVVGHRSWETARVVDLVEEHQIVGVTVEYRLAPEHPYPAGVEDCYEGLVWLANNATELAIDPDRIIVMGGSAGGGFAAAVSLLARERSGPRPRGQLLLCPMLDNTNSSASSRQFDGIGTWQRSSNLMAWECVLGADATSADAPPAASPSRATDLRGLPPAFIEVGSAEMFRDEDVDYATRIWRVGGSAELHVWSGGCHGFDMFCPDAEITRAALDARSSWLRRILTTP